MAGSSGAGYDPKVANLWAARIIPVLLVGIVGYVSWVIIELVCGKEEHLTIKALC
jgi:palmitoyltransferase